MKRIDVNGNPHLCLFALDDIQEGEEITYAYGGEDCPWRTQVCYSTHYTESEFYWNYIIKYYCILLGNNIIILHLI